MNKNRILSLEEEIELGRRAATDESARNALVMHNEGFLKRMVYAFYKNHREMDLEDLMQEGYVGMLNAAARFDPDRGIRFITYAKFWVQQALNLSLELSFGIVRIPSNRADELIRIRRVMIETGSSDPEFLAERVKASVNTVKCLLSYNHPTISLDSKVPTPSGTEGETMIARTAAIDVDFDHNIEIEELKAILDKLPERQREILMFRYGVFGHPLLSLKELSDMFGISREAIRQMEHRALAKCKEVA